MLTHINTLQAFWRKQTSIRKLANGFLELINRETSFEGLVAVLKDKAMLKTSKKCLMRIISLAGRTNNAIRVQATQINVRVFLGAWLIDRFPEKAFHRMEGSHAVSDGAKKMVSTFTALLEKIASEHGLPSTDEFMTDFNAFLPAFETWRVADKPVLLEKIRSSIRNVTLVLAHTPSELAQELEQVLAELRVKEQQLTM